MALFFPKLPKKNLAVDPAGKAAPPGGFQFGGWYSGYQYGTKGFTAPQGEVNPSRSTSSMVRKLVFFPQSILNKLDNLDDKSVNEHIRRAVDEYLERQLDLKSSKSPSITQNDTIYTRKAI